MKDEIFPLVVNEKKVIGFAITEANAGSDSGAIQTSAVLRDGSYVLNGTKIFITNGSVADYLLVSAVTSPGQKTWGGALLHRGCDFQRIQHRSRKMINGGSCSTNNRNHI